MLLCGQHCYPTIAMKPNWENLHIWTYWIKKNGSYEIQYCWMIYGQSNPTSPPSPHPTPGLCQHKSLVLASESRLLGSRSAWTCTGLAAPAPGQGEFVSAWAEVAAAITLDILWYCLNSLYCMDSILNISFCIVFLPMQIYTWTEW